MNWHDTVPNCCRSNMTHVHDMTSYVKFLCASIVIIKFDKKIRFSRWFSICTIPATLIQVNIDKIICLACVCWISLQFCQSHFPHMSITRNSTEDFLSWDDFEDIVLELLSIVKKLPRAERGHNSSTNVSLLHLTITMALHVLLLSLILCELRYFQALYLAGKLL